MPLNSRKYYEQLSGSITKRPGSAKVNTPYPCYVGEVFNQQLIAFSRRVAFSKDMRTELHM